MLMEQLRKMTEVFSDGSIKFSVDDITLKTTADLLGASYTEATETEPENCPCKWQYCSICRGVGYYKKGVKTMFPYF